MSEVLVKSKVSINFNYYLIEPSSSVINNSSVSCNKKKPRLVDKLVHLLLKYNSKLALRLAEFNKNEFKHKQRSRRSDGGHDCSCKRTGVD
jgi:hypothetical protein